MITPPSAAQTPPAALQGRVELRLAAMQQGLKVVRFCRAERHEHIAIDDAQMQLLSVVNSGRGASILLDALSQ
jgi:hypothetical protein